MCGIAGAVGFTDASRITREMLAAIAHRGPDGKGFIDSDDRSLGMCRLRIRGDASLQVPIWNETAGGWVAYNGEVYGARETEGTRIPAPSDSAGEVDLIYSAANGGAALDGMYATALISSHADTIELRRDAFGIKPLFWRRLPTGNLFASELTPLKLVTDHPSSIRQSAIAELLAFGRNLGDKTIYDDVHSVPPGGSLLLSRDGIERYSPDPATVDAPNAFAADLRESLRHSIERCLISDRPVGLALSGGLDSTIIAHDLNSIGVEGITTVSVRIPGVTDGLSDLGRLGFTSGGAWTTWRHKVVTFSPSDFQTMMDRAVITLGQPTRLTSAPLYLLLAQAASEAGIVVLLTGEGADELLSGYASYLGWRDGAARLNGWRRLLDFAFPSSRRSWVVRLLGPEACSICESRFQDAYEITEDMEPFQALRHLEKSLSLEPLLIRMDHCLMRFGVEGRTPYLHGDVPAVCATFGERALLSGDTTKLALRTAYSDALAGSGNLFPKRAFRLPIATWFSTCLSGWISERLRDRMGEIEEFGLRPDGVNALLDATLSGDAEASSLCFAVLSLLPWKDHCFQASEALHEF
ncbi:MAG: asparagine synthetase B [Acidobacteriota bacterium]